MFDLKAFLETGDMDAMPRLRPDDTVVLLSRERASGVKVIGGVRNPGFFNPEEPVNLFELIYLAGGPAEKGDLSRVRRFFRRDGTTIEEIIDLQSYLDKGEMDRVPMIDDGDVVIVYTRWFNWQTMMVILNNALLFLVTIQALTGMFR